MSEIRNLDVRTWDAREIVARSNRIDIHIKFAYARYYKAYGHASVEMSKLYLESIKTFNSFIEDDPLKKGPSDFLKHFQGLIESIRAMGYIVHDDHEQVRLGTDGEVISGAHRIATCAAYDTPVVFEVDSKTDYQKFDFEYFHKKGVSKHVLDLASLTKASLDNTLKCLVVHSNVPNEKFSEIITYIKKQPASQYSIVSKQLNLSAITALKYINYRSGSDISNNLDWTFPKNNVHSEILSHALSSYGKFETRLILFSEKYEGEINNLKKDLREKLGLNNFNIHSTEEHSEARNIIEIFCQPLLLHILSMNKPKNICNAFEKLMLARESLRKSGLKPHIVVVGGSMILELAGYRSARDIDLFVDNIADLNLHDLTDSADVNIEFHEISSLHNFSKVEELRSDTLGTFELLGFRFISLKELYEFKVRRSEFPKDKIDSRAISEILSLTSYHKINQSINMEALMLAWKILSKIKQLQKRIIIFLYKFHVVRRSYKFLKQIFLK